MDNWEYFSYKSNYFQILAKIKNGTTKIGIARKDTSGKTFILYYEIDAMDKILLINFEERTPINLTK